MASPYHPYVKFRRPNNVLARAMAVDPTWQLSELLKAYDWPTNLGGRGPIGIVELGGGWLPGDAILFSAQNNLPPPHITDFSVDGTQNNPGADPDSDGEVGLDIQLAGGGFGHLTGVVADIRIFWSQSIASAIRAATANHCAVCSISWGADEAAWSSADIADLLSAAQEAIAAGMIITAAAGDNDSRDGGPNASNVDLPGSNPYIICCGGTSRKKNGQEVVWNNNPGKSDGEGTGGGYSRLYMAQTWQRGAPRGPVGTGRMVPDLALNADPETGYNVVLNGQTTTIGGTSAVAPLIASYLAAVEPKGPASALGLITPAMWANPKCFRDITIGNNGDPEWKALIGPDPCSGLGVPEARQLAAALAGR